MKRIFKILGSLAVLLLLTSTIKSKSQIDVYATRDNQVVLNGYHYLPLNDLCDTLKIMISNPKDNARLPHTRVINTPSLGDIYASSAIISYASDRGTSYRFYIAVRNEIELAYNQLHDELARKLFNKPFKNLSKDQKNDISAAYPKKISEAEPD
ncbi:hypothetical protein [Owenweeksia hongkongensis]|uniref:hypothetical protein n=1 Tax=Owenweeksia hongkongensis TaxID=253245 RepID=UPI003A95C51F